MIRNLILFCFLLMAGTMYCQEDTIKKWAFDFTTELELENQFFTQKGNYGNQRSFFTSGAVRPKFNAESNNGRHKFQIELFGRASLHDDNRSHIDIREGYYRFAHSKFNLLMGSKKVFWGVTESNHLVDIINQTDQVEAFDATEKLGQPMVQFTFDNKLGAFEIYYLPIARRRQFAGENGRFRFPIAIERVDIPFTTSHKEWHSSFATRWNNTIGKLDLGISYFYGISREPLYLGFNPSKGLDLSYPTIHQIGIDAQLTLGATMLKLEAINRIGDRQKFVALVSGFEYTFGNVFNTGADLGVVSEYSYDQRGILTFSGLDNDVFIGSRFSLNDTGGSSVLVGGIFDLNRSTNLFRFQGSRRFNGGWKAELLMSLFRKVSSDEILFNFRQDNLIQVAISKFI